MVNPKEIIGASFDWFAIGQVANRRGKAGGAISNHPMCKRHLINACEPARTAFGLVRWFLADGGSIQLNKISLLATLSAAVLISTGCGGKIVSATAQPLAPGTSAVSAGHVVPATLADSADSAAHWSIDPGGAELKI